MRTGAIGYRRLILLSTAALTLCTLFACDDSGASSTSNASEAQERILISNKGPRPEYTIPIELRTAEPEAAAFVDRFLSVCLGGDYTGYRRLVSRTHKAESKERFEAMYLGVKSLTVEIIEPIHPGKRSRLPAETFRVVSKLEVRPDSRLEQRGIMPRIALLIFREQGEWRMIPAPERWQPQEEAPQAVEDAYDDEPAEPDFPWDEDIDG